MCGGIGSRFWPYSRTNLPKQFIDFFGTGRTLLQLTYDRIVEGGIVPKENVVLVTNSQYADKIRQQLPDIQPGQILFEPARRNTAPCIAWAAYHIHALCPEAQIMVAPSDHLILKEEEYRQSILRGFDFIAGRDALLTLGIRPSRPETGYGYIQIGASSLDNIHKVKTFTEKPNLELAKVFLATGEFMWNSGMFIWSAKSILRAIRQCAPDIAEKLDAGAGVFGTDGETAFIQDAFPACPNISIDFAVMEKADNVYVECVDIGWSDLGTWGALYDNSPKNVYGNVTQRCKALLFNSQNNVIAIKDTNKLLVASGLDDYIVADAGDVLLIVPKAEEQKIKLYVNEVKSIYGDDYI